jgi:hypothetical protein
VLTTFWTGMGGKLAERWESAIFSPTFVFWFGGFAVWLAGRDERGFVGAVGELTGNIGELSASLQVAVLVTALLVMTVSGVIVRALALPVLRLLEGYWPQPLDRAGRWLVERQAGRTAAVESRWRELALGQQAGTPTLKERDEYARLDRRRRSVPARRELRMPTRLGNVLRAAESRPGDRYGLDAVVCWPRLWLVLPETAQAEVTAARAVLNTRAETLLWAVLFAVWGVFAWWAPVVGLLVATAIYRSMLGAAAIYGDLIVSCYDLHRSELYKALRWPLPLSLQDEPAQGRALTQYLGRGTAAGTIVFAVEDPDT